MAEDKKTRRKSPESLLRTILATIILSGGVITGGAIYLMSRPSSPLRFETRSINESEKKLDINLFRSLMIENTRMRNKVRDYMKWHDSAKSGGLNAAHYDGKPLPGSSILRRYESNNRKIEHLRRKIFEEK